MGTGKNTDIIAHTEPAQSKKETNQALRRPSKTEADCGKSPKKSMGMVRFGKGTAIIRSLIAAVQFPVQSSNDLLMMCGGPDRILKYTVAPRLSRLFSMKDILTALPELEPYYPLQSFDHMIGCLAEIEKNRLPLPGRVHIQELNKILAKQKQIPQKTAGQRRSLAAGVKETEEDISEGGGFSLKCDDPLATTILPFGITLNMFLDRLYRSLGYADGYDVSLHLEFMEDGLTEANAKKESADAHCQRTENYLEQIKVLIPDYLLGFDANILERIVVNADIVDTEAGQAKSYADLAHAWASYARRQAAVVMAYINEHPDQDKFSDDDKTRAENVYANMVPRIQANVERIRSVAEDNREYAALLSNLAGAFPTVHSVTLSGHVMIASNDFRNAHLKIKNTTFAAFEQLEIENPLVGECRTDLFGDFTIIGPFGISDYGPSTLEIEISGEYQFCQSVPGPRGVYCSPTSEVEAIYEMTVDDDNPDLIEIEITSIVD